MAFGDSLEKRMRDEAAQHRRNARHAEGQASRTRQLAQMYSGAARAGMLDTATAYEGSVRIEAVCAEALDAEAARLEREESDHIVARLQASLDALEASRAAE
jgi:hypothetical protein